VVANTAVGVIAAGVVALASVPLSLQGPAVGSLDTASLVAQASVRASEFDLEGALPLLQAAGERGDAEAHVAALYIRGLIAARAAFGEGGADESLKPVRTAIAALGGIAKGRPGPAEIARLALQAAAAAAQSEREEMRLYLESATRMEALQRVAGQGGAPLVSAAEVAGDLWLQVSRFAEADRAYAAARERVGPTLRVLSGFARVARRVNDIPAACAAYQRLLDAWSARTGTPVEIAEAQTFLNGCPR
jgi:hypothetical protein